MIDNRYTVTVTVNATVTATVTVTVTITVTVTAIGVQHTEVPNLGVSWSRFLAVTIMIV